MEYTINKLEDGRYQAVFTDETLPKGLEITFSLTETTLPRLHARAAAVITSAAHDIWTRKLAIKINQPIQAVLF